MRRSLKRKRSTTEKTRRRPRAKAKKIPPCPECGSRNVVPVIHGIPTPRLQEAVRAGKAVLAQREEWEGMTEWYCKRCGCDWSGAWRRFRRAGEFVSKR